MADNRISESPQERKRRHDRERIAAKRAALTPEDRAALRFAADARYREVHREERRSYDRSRYETTRSRATQEVPHV